jgi:hypothetical protein
MPSNAKRAIRPSANSGARASQIVVVPDSRRMQGRPSP